MKVTVKRKEAPVPVTITTEYIKLEAAMKLANAVFSGGMAKTCILEQEVLVNGAVCTMRGKKLYPGDVFSFQNRDYCICGHEAN